MLVYKNSFLVILKNLVGHWPIVDLYKYINAKFIDTFYNITMPEEIKTEIRNKTIEKLSAKEDLLITRSDYKDTLALAKDVLASATDNKKWYQLKQQMTAKIAGVIILIIIMYFLLYAG